jgi:hypothetical protein
MSAWQDSHNNSRDVKKMTCDEDMFTQIMLLFSNLLAVIVAFLSVDRYTQLNYG